MEDAAPAPLHMDRWTRNERLYRHLLGLGLVVIPMTPHEPLEAFDGYAADQDHQLDPGIRAAVDALRAEGVETFESCEGGEGHAYPEPTIRFHGDRSEGFRALAVAMRSGLTVTALRRTWPILECEPTGPWWEMTLATAILYFAYPSASVIA